MNYILPNNVKAIDHFKSINATLTNDVKTITTTYYGDSNNIFTTYPIILVSGGIFDNMTSKQFHKYLKQNNLLLTKSLSKWSKH